MTRLTPKAITEASMEELPKGNLDTRFSNRIAFGLGVKYSESIYIPQIEKLQGEIERLRELGYTTLNDYREESKMRIEAEKERAQLTAKHERLVKGIHDLPIHVRLIRNISFTDASVDETEAQEVYLKSDVIDLLTEEGNV